MEKTKFRNLLLLFVVLIFLFSMMTTSLATNETNEDSTSNGTTTLELVENTVCHIDVGGYGEFEKRITEFNETEKSATLTLTLTNTKSVEEDQRDVEIFFVIDNSSSMVEDPFEGEGTRKDAVIAGANSLIGKLYDSNPSAKIGVVGFSSLNALEGETEGTINDANLLLGLSNSETEVLQAITDLSNLETGPRTNIEAGLTIAQENFSSEPDVDRYIVLLTDGLPNNATDGTYGTYSGVVATRTKAKLEEIEASGVSIISAMINLPDGTETSTNKTYQELAEEVFGTVENPTTDVYYDVTDSEIEDTIVNDIYDDLIVRVDNTLRNIVIKDYFPQEIIDNFNFEYVASPNIGTVSQTVDTTDNSITWNIELLSEGEVATLSYKLTLKDDYNKEIVDQILPTNTHVDITGENNDNTIEVTSDDSPTIVVRYHEPIVIPDTNEVDNTVAPDPIPQTGESTLLIALISVLVIVVVSRTIYLRKNSDK